jgi:hypothetical protein
MARRRECIFAPRLQIGVAAAGAAPPFPGLARLSAAVLPSRRRFLARLGSARLGSARLDSSRLGVRPRAVLCCAVLCYAARLPAARPPCVPSPSAELRRARGPGGAASPGQEEEEGGGDDGGSGGGDGDGGGAGGAGGRGDSERSPPTAPTPPRGSGSLELRLRSCAQQQRGFKYKSGPGAPAWCRGAPSLCMHGKANKQKH